MNNDKELAIRPEPFQLMDYLDDQAILAEIEGRVVETWVYSFSQAGKEVYGLSKVGVDQACIEMAKSGNVIREEGVTVSKDPIDESFLLFEGKASRYIIKEEREIKMETVCGMKRQSIYLDSKTNPPIPDKFWFEKGSMKALRNAKSRLILEEVKARIIALAKELGKTKLLTQCQSSAFEIKPQPNSKKATERQPSPIETKKPNVIKTKQQSSSTAKTPLEVKQLPSSTKATEEEQTKFRNKIFMLIQKALNLKGIEASLMKDIIFFVYKVTLNGKSYKELTSQEMKVITESCENWTISDELQSSLIVLADCLKGKTADLYSEILKEMGEVKLNADFLASATTKLKNKFEDKDVSILHEEN